MNLIQIRRFSIVDLIFSPEDYKNLAKKWNLYFLNNDIKLAVTKLLDLWDDKKFPLLPLGPALLKDFQETLLLAMNEKIPNNYAWKNLCYYIFFLNLIGLQKMKRKI